MDLKYYFLPCLLLLAAASVATQLSLPSRHSRHPVLHWATDDNPERVAQVAGFERWLRRHHYRYFTLRLDFVNDDLSKDIIQGVSGDADDLMDMYSFGQMDFMQACGLLYNVAPDAQKMGFDSNHTWPVLRSYLVHKGRQYLYPRSVGPLLYWVNRATFARYRQPVPPRNWTFGQFQRRGLAFVHAANAQPRRGSRQKVFFANAVDTRFMRRSLGLSIFNATLTRCILNDPRYVRVLRLAYRWTFVDHLVPTPAQQASFATRTGYAGPMLQLFNSGDFGMIYTGRFVLVQLRRFYKTSGALALAVSDPPYGRVPSSVLAAGGPAIYIGSAHKKLAEYFLAYLASRGHNMQIARDGDDLPPNPIYTRTRAFLSPRRYPNEFGCSGAFAQAARTIALPAAYSPFVLDSTVTRIVQGEAEAGFMAGIYTARQAARLAADRINRRIAENVRASPRLQKLYTTLVRRQRRIDHWRQAGRAIPPRLIRNPFYRWYYGRVNQNPRDTSGLGVRTHV